MLQSATVQEISDHCNIHYRPTVSHFCRSTDNDQILTIILWCHSWKVFIPEAVVRLPITKPQVAVPVNLQVCEVVVVERLPRHIPSNIWSWISATNAQTNIVTR